MVENARTEVGNKLKAFHLRNIWNCDESGLQYNKQPAYCNLRKEKGNVLKEVKLNKTQITTFHSVNADGSKKRPLTVIGRGQTPQAFRQKMINIHNLPIVYGYNTKACMLSGLWYEYL